MNFISLSFWVFFALFSLVYFLTRGRVRLYVSLVASYIFYGCWDVRFLSLIIGLTLINYYAGLAIAVTTTQRHRNRWLSISVVSSLGILGIFKYFNFFQDTVYRVLDLMGFQPGQPVISILLPVGISFYTFQTMSYTIDLYRGKCEVEKSLARFATFVAFFPQLVAGPIVRASDFLPQLHEDRRFDPKRVQYGINLVLWGLVMKVVVADTLAVISDSRFHSIANQNSLSMTIGLLSYTFQIYGDFCGYSLIAIGLARVLGYEFPVNFNRPYFAVSFSDFWQRWHISLSGWLRDYLYIPLGGNRRGPRRTMINLMLTMLLGGLWHGANWTFVIWGGLHGLYLILQRLLAPISTRIKSRSGILLVRMAGGILTFVAVMLAWVFFRAQSLEDALSVLRIILLENTWSFAAVTEKFFVIKGMCLIGFLAFLEWLSFRIDFLKCAEKYPWLNALGMALMLAAVAVLGTFTGASFIYFQF